MDSPRLDLASSCSKEVSANELADLSKGNNGDLAAERRERRSVDDEIRRFIGGGNGGRLGREEEDEFMFTQEGMKLNRGGRGDGLNEMNIHGDGRR
ncbi:hypothetical protein L195_g003017 [Trifolium pratense]|uniref:Uncharacterized protein n=1 Tax=Trifolium pratense TaxID=57577 RepID=A0A2K3NU33_TRIPR|nr:hypothetical protein L195_g003017 [Trifolium pratense]